MTDTRVHLSCEAKDGYVNVHVSTGSMYSVYVVSAEEALMHAGNLFAAAMAAKLQQRAEDAVDRSYNGDRAKPALRVVT